MQFGLEKQVLLWTFILSSSVTKAPPDVICIWAPSSEGDLVFVERHQRGCLQKKGVGKLSGRIQ